MLVRVYVLSSMSHNIVALALLTPHKHVHPQSILRSLRTSVLKLIAMLMMIKTARLPTLVDLVDLTTLSLSVHKLRTKRNYVFLSL